MTEPKDDDFLQRVRSALDQSARELDELTVARLRAVRHQALEAPPRRRTGLWITGLTAGAIAAGLVALLVIAPVAAPPATGLESLDLLVEAEIDLYDDLEFYRWLAESGHAG